MKCLFDTLVYIPRFRSIANYDDYWQYSLFFRWRKLWILFLFIIFISSASPSSISLVWEMRTRIHRIPASKYLWKFKVCPGLYSFEGRDEEKKWNAILVIFPLSQLIIIQQITKIKRCTFQSFSIAIRTVMNF